MIRKKLEEEERSTSHLRVGGQIHVEKIGSTNIEQGNQKKRESGTIEKGNLERYSISAGFSNLSTSSKELVVGRNYERQNPRKLYGPKLDACEWLSHG